MLKAILIYICAVGLQGYKPEYGPLASGLALEKESLILHNSLLGTWLKPI